jgi:hypothetical protein
MASTALSPELVCGHMLVQVDILEKAVNELDARQIKAVAEQDAKHIRAEATQSAAMQLLQSLHTQMTELRDENQALRARLEEERMTMSTQLQEIRAHNQALAARLNAELELPRSASGASRPATLEELIQRRDALVKIKAAKMDCVMVKAAGYTCAEARQAGYTCAEARHGGYTCAEARQGGFTLAEMKQGGYTCAEAKHGGYKLAEVKQAGYTLAEMKKGCYTCEEARLAGFNTRECKQAGFTDQEGWMAGFPSHYSWGKTPLRIEPRLTLAARALRLRAPPSARRGGPRPPPCRRACGPPAFVPVFPTHARSTLVRVASSRGGAGHHDWNGRPLD